MTASEVEMEIRDADDSLGVPPRGARPVAVFYAKVRDPALFDLIEFYAEDIRSLEELGFEVIRSNSVWRAARADGDLLFAWWWHSASPVIAIWRLRRRPVAVTGTSQLFEPLGSRRLAWAVRTGLIAIASRLATVNVAVSEYEAKKLGRIGAPRIAVLRHSVNTSYYSPGRKAEVPTAVVIAQMNAASMMRKGVDVAIRATELIREQIPTFRLLLIGPISPDGQEYIDKLRGETSFVGVTVLGEVSREEKRRRLQESWLYLQPSTYEGFGVAVLEAMACGAVPICSSAAALPEVVANAGVVLPCPEPAVLATAAIKLVADRPRLDRLTVQARERSLDFDSARHTSGLKSILGGARVAHFGKP